MIRKWIGALLVGLCASVATAADIDTDGLPDSMETWLDSFAFDADGSAIDTDGDGLHDGFEYAISGRVDGPAGPSDLDTAVRIACYRETASSLVEVIALVVGDPATWDTFGVWRADGFTEPELLDGMVERVVMQGAAELRTFRATVRVADLIAAPDGIALSVVGSVGGVAYYSSGTLVLAGGDPWFERYDGPMVPYGEGTGDLEPCDPWSYFASPTEAPDMATTGTGSGGGVVTSDEVCGTADRREPTETPGLLRSVVLSAGCTSGSWACPAGVCTVSGSVGAEKPVIDVFTLIAPSS